MSEILDWPHISQLLRTAFMTVHHDYSRCFDRPLRQSLMERFGADVTQPVEVYQLLRALDYVRHVAMTLTNQAHYLFAMSPAEAGCMAVSIEKAWGECTLMLASHLPDDVRDGTRCSAKLPSDVLDWRHFPWYLMAASPRQLDRYRVIASRSTRSRAPGVTARRDQLQAELRDRFAGSPGFAYMVLVATQLLTQQGGRHVSPAMMRPELIDDLYGYIHVGIFQTMPQQFRSRAAPT